MNEEAALRLWAQGNGWYRRSALAATPHNECEGLPHRRHSFPGCGYPYRVWMLTFDPRTIWLAEVVPLVDFGDATPAVALSHRDHDL